MYLAMSCVLFHCEGLALMKDAASYTLPLYIIRVLEN